MLDFLTIDGLLGYARARAKREYRTLTRGAPFRIKIEGDTLSFIAAAKGDAGKLRPNGRVMLEKYVSIFNRHRNFLTGPYVTANLHDSSYFLTLVAEMIDRRELAANDDESRKLLNACDSSLEKELTLFCSRTTRHSQDRARNIELIAYYFGFRQDPSPSQVDTAKIFGIKTRERARQVLKDYFYGKAAPEDLPSLVRIGELLEAKSAIAASRFLGELRSAGLISERASARGLLDLLQEGLGLCFKHQIYTPELDEATREKWGRTEEVFFIRDDGLQILRPALKAVATRPGKEGIAEFFSALRTATNLSAEQERIVREFVVATPSVWTFEEADTLFYLFEDRVNPLINQLEKIHGVTNVCPLGELVQGLCRGAALRGKEKLVEAWLGQTELITICGRIATISAECKATALTPAERDAYAFLTSPENHDTPAGPLRKWMQVKGHPKATGDSIVFRSSFIHIAEKEGARSRTYRLIGSGAGAALVPSDAEMRYLEFKEKLRRIGKDGTDRVITSRQRKEQEALQDWIFGKGTEFRCAICGRVFSRDALRVAHKKPRNICTQIERLDPHIVMPLCLLGCDFLYEEGHIYVDDRTVAVRPNDRLPQGMKAAIEAVAGRKLAEMWTAGSSSNFRPMRPVG